MEILSENVEKIKTYTLNIAKKIASYSNNNTLSADYILDSQNKLVRFVYYSYFINEERKV